MLRVSTPGLGGSSSSPQEPSQAYLLQNMVSTPDGVWRPRPGFKLVRDLAGPQVFKNLGSVGYVTGAEILHLKGWAQGQIFGTNRVEGDGVVLVGEAQAFWSYKEVTNDLLALDDYVPPTSMDWFPSTPCVKSLVDGTYQYMMAFPLGEGGTYSTVDNTSLQVVEGTRYVDWVETHGGYVVACGGLGTKRGIYWSNYFDPTTFDALSVATADHRIGEPVAIVPWEQGISFILGRIGVGELQGNDSQSFVFRSTLGLPAAPAPNTVQKIGDSVFFLVPGPRLVRLGLGGYDVISGPIDRELRALTTLRNLRCWHDSYHNLYCLSNPASGKTHLYSPEEQRWVGHWSRGDGLTWLGEARCEDARSHADASRLDWAPPFAAIYVAAGSLLGRWDPSLTVDESAGADLDIECAVETPPEDAPRMSNYKQLSSVVLNGRGTWTIKLRYRQAQDDSWTDETLGTLSAPGKVYGSLTCYKQGIVRAESTDPTCRFRSLEIQEVDRGGY